MCKTYVKIMNIVIKLCNQHFVPLTLCDFVPLEHKRKKSNIVNPTFDF
jgi:hypothetical protein